MRADYHVHSEFSDDSDTPMEAQLDRAVELGLDELCFTDHVDYGVKHDWDEPAIPRRDGGAPKTNVDYPRYFAKLDELARRYEGRVTLRRGLELGVQSHTIDRYNDLFELYGKELDFTLLSVHEIGDQELWLQKYQRGKTQKEYNLGYYEELLRVVERFEHYSVLAHMDLIVRYDENGVYPFENVRDVAAEILRRVIRDGKGIELNSASWHYGLADTQPSRALLRLYRDLGGTVLTLGSDAHTPRYLADHFDDARAILRSLGFEHFYTFEKMVPIRHAL